MTKLIKILSPCFKSISTVLGLCSVLACAPRPEASNKKTTEASDILFALNESSESIPPFVADRTAINSFEFEKTFSCNNQSERFKLVVKRNETSLIQASFYKIGEDGNIEKFGSEFDFQIDMSRDKQNYELERRHYDLLEVESDCRSKIRSGCAIKLTDPRIDPYKYDGPDSDFPIIFPYRMSLETSMSHLVEYGAQTLSVATRFGKIVNRMVFYEDRILECEIDPTPPEYLNYVLLNYNKAASLKGFSSKKFFQQIAPYLDGKNREFLAKNVVEIEKQGLDTLELAEWFDTNVIEQPGKFKFDYLRVQMIKAGGRLFLQGTEDLSSRFNETLRSRLDVLSSQTSWESCSWDEAMEKYITERRFEHLMKPIYEEFLTSDISYPLSLEFAHGFYWRKIQCDLKTRKPIFGNGTSGYKDEIPHYERIEFRDLTFYKDPIFIQYALKNIDYKDLLSFKNTNLSENGIREGELDWFNKVIGNIPEKDAGNSLRSWFDRSGLNILNELHKKTGINFISENHLEKEVAEYSKLEIFSLAHDICRELRPRGNNNPIFLSDLDWLLGEDPIARHQKNIALFKDEMKLANVQLTVGDFDQIDKWKLGALTKIKNREYFFYARYVADQKWLYTKSGEPKDIEMSTKAQWRALSEYYGSCMNRVIEVFRWAS